MGIPRELDENKEINERPSHNNKGVRKFVHQKAPKVDQLIIQHYQGRCKSLEGEEGTAQGLSPIVNLKWLHSSIKMWLIHMYAKVGDGVLDLACGKGGDLMKWKKVDVGYYLGIDIVEGLVNVAKRRYETLGCPFLGRFICADGFSETLVRERLRNEQPFDICSCQFALHYSWSTEQRARATLANVATMLKPGGFFIGTILDANRILKKLRETSATSPDSDKPRVRFGNKLYTITFDSENKNKALSLPLQNYIETHNYFGIQYEFDLVDAIDHCPEWLVPLCALTKIALEYNLELVFSTSFHHLIRQQHMEYNYHRSKTKISPLSTSTPLDFVTSEEWECVSLYLAFAFKKRGTS